MSKSKDVKIGKVVNSSLEKEGSMKKKPAVYDFHNSYKFDFGGPVRRWPKRYEEKNG